MLLKFLVQLFTSKNFYFKSNNYLTIILSGVFPVVMLFSNIKIINKLIALKTTLIKAGIMMSLATYWGVILVGTFITFS